MDGRCELAKGFLTILTSDQEVLISHIILHVSINTSISPINVSVTRRSIVFKKNTVIRSS